ncbi:hypothetical protein ABZ345_14180 [Lentzea sp. NPDC005914]|uniref:hypothetical protein n=1 Tax=Lentzea sp. NPDC005914 TaxID=3154572 RepID=UPI0033F08A63
MDTDLLRQLNDDIWHPFKLAYSTLDAAAFLDLHAPELIRAGGQTKQVFGFADYCDQTEKWFAGLADRSNSVAISFRFVERIASNDLASERGFFKIVSKRADGDVRTFYAASTYMRDARTDGGASATTTTPTNGQRRWRRSSSPRLMSTTSRRSAHRT